MKRFFALTLATLVLSFSLPWQSAFAAGVSPSGGGSKTVGQTFAIKITASGAEFDSLQGTIATSGPVSIVSVSAGGATWLPGKTPSANGSFVGITSPTKSLTVATINLKGTKEGKGAVSVSGVKLARNGSYVGSDGGTTSFTIGRAPTPPGEVALTSSTHPDQNQAYETTTVTISWASPANGATGYATLWNNDPASSPESKVTTTETTATFADQKIGTYYFHIKAQNGDGWGPVSHFKVTIKEPDAKVDPSLQAPTITSVKKADSFTTDIEKGTVSGVKISGSGGLPGYTIVLSIEPKDKLPASLFQPITTEIPVESTDPSDAGATPTVTATPESTAAPLAKTPLMTVPSDSGNWEIVVSEPIPAGFYKLTSWGILDKTLTPQSPSVSVELSVAKGGRVSLITSDDATTPTDRSFKVFGVSFASTAQFYLALTLLILLGLVIWLTKKLIVKSWPFERRPKVTTSEPPRKLN